MTTLKQQRLEIDSNRCRSCGETDIDELVALRWDPRREAKTVDDITIVCRDCSEAIIASRRARIYDQSWEATKRAIEESTVVRHENVAAMGRQAV